MDEFDTGWDLEKIHDTVILLREYWDHRSPQIPFYTLGKAAYLDENTDAYFEGVKTVNPILKDYLGFMYDDLKDMLSAILREPVGTLPSVALPGFHVFPSDPVFLGMWGNWHVDIPHQTLSLGNQEPWAFTVAITLPTGGAGQDRRIDNKEVYLEYEPGKMYLTNGETVHRITSYKEYVPNEYRVTLQGHLIRVDGSLIMFW